MPNCFYQTTQICDIKGFKEFQSYNHFLYNIPVCASVCKGKPFHDAKNAYKE